MSHDHYPTDALEGTELYEDLMEVAGLQHEPALETVGYAFGQAATMCPYVDDSWSITKEESMFAFPYTVERSPENLQTYLHGIALGVKAARDERGVLHV